MRLLLFIAALTALTAAFSLNFFSSQSKPYLHPLSPSEVDPAGARAKRQAYQVYVDGDSSVSVDKTGQAESGAWGPWTPDNQCSRTCGGGVQVEKRQCNGECTGPSVRYVTCNSEPCAAGGDFRAEQCAAHNDDDLDGNYHKWIPYKGRNKCELLCKPEIGDFYYKWGDKVVDGTPCDTKGEEVCVDGVCLPLGCDGKLGSSKKVDKCGICDGDGTKCKTVEGFFDERNLSPGYHDIIKLPVGATGIKIEEARSSSNNLALKNATGAFILNGKSMIQVIKDIEAAGTVFEYDDDKPERIHAQGPLSEEITVALLFRKNNKDAAIRYEFSVPLDEEIAYMYKPGDWSACSVTCGKGEQKRTPFCIDTASQQRVNDDLCDENNATKPEFEKSCETVDCEAEWFEGEWEQCSQTCGDLGEQYRVVYCHKVFANGNRMTVDDSECSLPRPAVRQSCNRFACPEWQAGPWSACSEKCGDAFQYRSVTCRSEKEGEEGTLLAADACPPNSTIETQRSCNLGPCEGLKFFTTEWNLCSKCNDTEETRDVTCKDTSGRAYALEKCLNEDNLEIPIDTRSCATQQPCIYEWTTSQWSQCSTECGHGHKTRRVVCAIHQLGDLEIVDEYHCSGEKPEERTNCTNEEKCTGTWYTGPWSECTAECGGGKQERLTVCLNYDKKPVPQWCDELNKPSEEQDCNTDECPTCFDSDFGCCPDNTTFATGEFNQGCSNCSLSEFGCCADNVTEATGANFKGCPEFVESPLNIELESEGSGDSPTLEIAEAPAQCNVTSADGDEATVECAAQAIIEVGEFANDTDASNGTIHCSKTTFGCCPDWFTAASGKGNEGCPQYVLGVCNETQFGCCPDNVTLARGSNFEGCGEPSCAASLYGCCKDRKTIAFGPHFAGCERSSFPCELSEFGCCPDGETAALGKNGKGCGENCLTTKYGCCPDGNTTAKGHHNEGCGCEYAQFGCCPDGKSSAKGAGYFGCPDSCAQSQHGCCPDGKTKARGPHKEGCPCQYTRYGCCPDGETTALGAKMEGCDDCHYAKYGCCDDGSTKALGPNNAGCPATTTPPYFDGGTVSPLKITSCNQPQDPGTVCGAGWKMMWFYDVNEGRCSKFWYGGCGGNENRYHSEEMCETICVEPPELGRCYLPKVAGPMRCEQSQPRYYYDHNTRQCAAFWWRGCLGNSNNFNSWEECSTFCKGVGPIESTTPAPVPEGPYQEQPYETPIEIESATPAPQPQQPQPDQQPQPQAPRLTLEEICRSTQDAGPCQDYSEQFYYDAYKGTCEKFTYGGCGGNRNRFPTADECLLRCGFLNPQNQQQQQQQQQQPQQPIQNIVYEPSQQPQTQPSQPQPIIPSKSRDACLLKMDVGRCKGAFDMWYFEPATGSCEQFKFTGCGGNQNKFSNKNECESTCVQKTSETDGPPGANSVCDEAKDTGPCTEFVTKWFYNKADGTCNRFHYGGCKGTGNRFDNEQSCKAACSHHQDACTLPKVQGPCSGRHAYYFFNSATQQCETFTYGGCLGNMNRFATVEECQARCAQRAGDLSVKMADPEDGADRCSLNKDAGNCRGSITKYYFDVNLGSCDAFIYTGCGGNANNFDSLSQCQKACSQSQAMRLDQPIADEAREDDWNIDLYRIEDDVRVSSLEQNDEALQRMESEESKAVMIPISIVPELCQLPEERGSCFDKILRWRYDSEIDECVSFMYSGCDGNANHFSSLEACDRACGRYRDPGVCQLPAEAGSCTQYVAKWFYDANAAECKMMMWSGCGGNGNRFSSREECNTLCREEIGWLDSTAVCTLPRSAGPCSDAVSMWYFDNEESECRQFTYGGCRGNENRFVDKASCEKRCGEQLQSLTHISAEVCRLPFMTGPCTQLTQKWYYDFATGQCHQFSYGGCDGNDNRFDSRSHCLSACGRSASSEQERARLMVSVDGPVPSGSRIALNCDARGVQPIVWYKDGGVLVFSQRVQEENEFEDVVISSSEVGDSGAYACATGPDGLFSNIVHLKIYEIPSTEPTCKDEGSANTCRLIVKSNLCGSRRYGKFCCRSCQLIS